MKTRVFLLSAGLLSLGAYAATPAAAPNVHDLMKKVFAVQTQIVWDVGNNAQDDNGNPDASKLTAADWDNLIKAAAQVRQASETLAKADKLMAAAPGQKLDGEGTTPGAYTVKQVQAAIDRNPKAFKAFATAMAVSMKEIESAAKTRDAKKLFDASGAIDQVCENCHKQFWYPEENVP